MVKRIRDVSLQLALQKVNQKNYCKCLVFPTTHLQSLKLCLNQKYKLYVAT